MFTNSKTDNKTATILDTSLLAIFGGVASSALFPPYAPFGTAMTASGVAGIAYYFATWSKFDRLWKNLNLCKGTAYPMQKSKKESDCSTIYTFTLPTGLGLKDFENKKDEISQFLGKDIDIKYTYKAIQIEVFDEKMKSVYDYEVVPVKGKMEIPIGYDRRGKLITCDLSSGEPHLLIAGETGSGKSTVLRSIITNLILANDVKLHLIDLKYGTEFQIFAKCKKVENFCRTKGEAENVLQLVNKEIERRYDLFFKNDCIDIKEYNRKFGGMDYQVLVIDEFADLKAQKGSISLLEEISAKARACGIHLIISTQRPDHIVLNGRIKANVTTVLGLKTMNEGNSRIIIDHEGLEKLAGKGQGIFKRGKEAHIQCPYLSADKARKLLKPTYIDKTPIATIEREVEVDLLC